MAATTMCGTRTIILLSAKRCGSTAVHRIFANHPDVAVAHVDQNIRNWEPNFWNLAARAVDGEPGPFLERLQVSHPYLVLPSQLTEDSVFSLWNCILEELGPWVFDKSPQYLGDEGGWRLLCRYLEQGHDVRFFAMIRDPRDAITSQHELWHHEVAHDSPHQREMQWLEKYHHLERIREHVDIPIFRYEDFCSSPGFYARSMLDHCGLENDPAAYSHIVPTSVGRYSASLSSTIRQWRFSDAFSEHLEDFGYRTPQTSAWRRLALVLGHFPGNSRRRLQSFVGRG